jgi:putative ABC transport system ATP-binding protein
LSSLIKLQQVTKEYLIEGAMVTALRAVDFELYKGEMTAIIGASGSGKSTLMNIIGCLDRCTGGNYFFSGQNVSHLTEVELATIRNEKIGFIFQSFFLLSRMNALQNVMIPLFYRNIPNQRAKEMAMHMLEKMGVGHLANHKPNQLSGGQQQRVAISRALVGNPNIILADEPTGALDSKTGHEIMNLFEALNQEGRTILIITHDREISHRCNRIVTIKDGKII